MPIYTFNCSNCTLTFEKSLRVSDGDEIKCPTCSNIAKKLPPKNVVGRMAEVKSLPKDVDLKVGADADKRWEEYEEKKSVKEKIRKETKSDWLSRDLDGGYSPLTVVKDNEVVSGSEAVEIRKDMWNEVKNPEVEKTGDAEESSFFNR